MLLLVGFAATFLDMGVLIYRQLQNPRYLVAVQVAQLGTWFDDINVDTELLKFSVAIGLDR